MKGGYKGEKAGVLSSRALESGREYTGSEVRRPGRGHSSPSACPRKPYLPLASVPSIVIKQLGQIIPWIQFMDIFTVD